jgi:type I restriction enzyme M protein
LSSSESATVRGIFTGARSRIAKPTTLASIVREIARINWYEARQEGFGDLYEGLLAKNATEKVSGAGQYFTPRPLIDSIVSVMQPQLGETIQDPAAGTGGFLVSAKRYIEASATKQQLSRADADILRRKTFFGLEHVLEVQRLALMNLVLHDIGLETDGGGIHHGDALGIAGEALCRRGATIILSNPPFGTAAGGGLPTRGDLPHKTSNKQLCFLQHIYCGLLPGGRAAVIVPDNVLFESGVGRDVRRDLLERCNVHTILRLPPGIFYAQGVKTNVIFFTRGWRATENTKETWIYDLRTSMPQFGRRAQFTREHLRQFEQVFGADPAGGESGLAQRRKVGESIRFRRFTREAISAGGDSLDLSWFDDSDRQMAGDPAVLLGDAVIELRLAVEELEQMISELRSGGHEV